MNRQVIELQRDLLLEQLAEVEATLKKEGIMPNKKYYTLIDNKGIWYVKYYDPITQKQIPTNRSLGTSNEEEAHKRAVKYRESFIKEYFEKKNGVKNLMEFFGNYYKLEKSEFLTEILEIGKRKLSSSVIKKYDSFINMYFLPFLTEKEIKRLNQLTLPVFKDFQLYLLKKGTLKPQTINDRIDCGIKPIFKNLVEKGIIDKNIDDLENLKEAGHKKERKILPIYEVLAILMDADMWKLYKEKDDIDTDKIANYRHWQKYRLVCMLMATCGLRSAEIYMLRRENIITIRRTKFLDINNSHIGDTGVKTKNSIRKVPLPTITLKALDEYIADNNITDFLFYTGGKTIAYDLFMYAGYQLGGHCGLSVKELKDKNIVFYSLRKSYKTMLSQSKIEEWKQEYFMGHAVKSADMGDNYRNRDDLDDWFFEKNGIEVIQYIDNLCDDVWEKYDILETHYHIEQITLPYGKGYSKTLYGKVLNKVDFDDENYYFIDDLYDKGFLSGNNEEDILNELKELFENGVIDKRKYGDAVYHIKNKVDFE